MSEGGGHQTGRAILICLQQQSTNEEYEWNNRTVVVRPSRILGVSMPILKILFYEQSFQEN